MGINQSEWIPTVNNQHGRADGNLLNKDPTVRMENVHLCLRPVASVPLLALGFLKSQGCLQLELA